MLPGNTEPAVHFLLLQGLKEDELIAAIIGFHYTLLGSPKAARNKHKIMIMFKKIYAVSVFLDV